MRVFSYEFFCMWVIALILFYSVGCKFQWQVITVASIFFYCYAIDKIPMVLIIVWLSTFFMALYIEKNRNRFNKILLYIIIVICIIVLVVGRATNIFVLLGNSYFTLKAISYVIDTERGSPAEKNILKYLLFLIYWPTICEGPFNRIDEFEKNFISNIHFDYISFTHGIQRFIWGTFKKLVIAERLGLYVNYVYNNVIGAGGYVCLLATIAFAVQLYADFSGFMDMMIGISSTFGIELPENFKQPYFSKSIPEFWRRWHITLGTWFRDYVMFPFVSCKLIKKLGKSVRKRNKNLGKMIPPILGTILVWVLVGLWHGLSLNYFIWGVYYAILISSSLIFDGISKNIKINKEEIWYINIIAVIKTIVLVIIGDTIICAHNLTEIKNVWYEIIYNFGGGNLQTLLYCGLEKKDILIIIIGIIGILGVSIIKEAGKSVQSILDEKPLVVRWGVLYVLIFFVLIYGLYGVQYDASQFLYMQF